MHIKKSRSMNSSQHGEGDSEGVREQHREGDSEGVREQLREGV